jgi:hypothetical protein
LFQPESFDEKQEAVLGKLPVSGGIETVQFKHWSAREITVRFLVSAVDAPDSTNEEARSSSIRDSDPEQVWAAIIELQRPAHGGLPQEVPVTIPGWGGGGRVGGGERVRVEFRGQDDKGNITGYTDGEGWDVYNGAWPTKAIIKSASISRTHIDGSGAAVRATISVTLVESVEISFDPKV